DLQWKDAFVAIAVNDLRGTREALMLDWGGTKHPLLPGSQVPGYTTGATASLGTEQPIASETEFSIPLDFNGSEGIYFAPFGVQLLSFLDEYRYVERSIKYGVLFLVLVFTTFFLFEVTARQKIHPFQYLMVGAALCLFYLPLLSISEFIGFSCAYLIAGVASTGLITWYCRFFLGGGARTLMIGAGLAGVYTFLYITLRQQDYALLMGSIA